MNRFNPETGEYELHEWKTPYNHNTLTETTRTALICLDETRTQQHGKEEADINTIVARFVKTGTIPAVAMPPTYHDFDDVFDFQAAMNLINAGKNAFMQMDPAIRDAFNNDPARFVDQVTAMVEEPDPAKREENLQILRGFNLAVPPGPIADRTTLGDVLKAIKEQGTPKEAAPPKNP